MKDWLAWAAWPCLLILSVLGTAWGFRLGHPDLGFYVTYSFLVLSLLFLQRFRPFETDWLERDGQLFNDIAHSVVSTGAVQAVLSFTAVILLSQGTTAWLGEGGIGLWPTGWPLGLQVAFGLIILEIALYWAHRLAHEWRPLWVFHAVHHSVNRLSVINNGRFHAVDAVKSVLPGVLLLIFLGAPTPVLTWLSALGAYIGMLTHSNVAMRFGPLSWIFNTPELHRWHHSRDPREGNRNYGESLMVWDWIFGTWFNPARRPPTDIGVPEPMPAGFVGQLLWPFREAIRRVPRPGR